MAAAPTETNQFMPSAPPESPVHDEGAQYQTQQTQPPPKVIYVEKPVEKIVYVNHPPQEKQALVPKEEHKEPTPEPPKKEKSGCCTIL